MSTKPAPKKRQSAKKKKPRQKTFSHTTIIVFLLSTCGLATLLIGTGLAWFLSLHIPDIRTASDYRPQVATVLLDRNKQPIDAIYNEYRIVIPYATMPSLLPQAFVAAEDSRYWEHGGLDLWSIFRAAINNLRSGRRSQGGSTITQQVTRSLMLSREKSYLRKITEAVLAYRLDHMLSKKEILAIYLNEIYLGEGAYGVEAAARKYFGKKAAQLSLAEIAILAGLPQAPSKYSPIKHPQAAKARQRYVLNRLAEDGIINAQTARHAYKQEIKYLRSGEQKTVHGYFAQYVRRQLLAHYETEDLFHRGLTVATTLDSRMQVAAAKALNLGVEQVAKRTTSKQPPQGALVALESRTGRVRVMIGGTGYDKSEYNRAVLAQRQPGSVFKPLIYAAALEKGFTLDTELNDAPLAIRNNDGTTWRPKNFDNTHAGQVSLSEALIKSNNIIAIKLLQQTGLNRVRNLAGKAGIRAELKPELPLALGASPVSVLEMTGAYAVFANRGMYHAPVAIKSVTDQRGKVIPWPQSAAKQIISQQTAQQINGVLAQVIRRGTGKKASGVSNSCGKTGTSDKNRDAWFIGYTPKLTTGVWLGYDRGKSLGHGETGGRSAAPVWKNFMLQVN